MDNIRLFLVATLSFLGLLLWQAWDADYGSVPASVAVEPTVDAPELPRSDDSPDLPVAAANETLTAAAPAVTGPPSEAPSDPAGPAHVIDVRTDLFDITLSTTGGNLVRAALRDYPVDPKAPEVSVELLGEHPPQVFVYQGGLAGQGALPNHHSIYHAESTSYTMAAGADELVVPLSWRSDDGIEVEKRYRFKRDRYTITVEYEITNGTAAPLRIHQYEQLKRNEESSRQGMVYTYTGAALSIPEKRFEKFDFDDLEEQAIAASAADSWIGILQHYFVAALVPPPTQVSQYYSKVLENHVYLVGFLSPAAELLAGRSHTFTSTIFIGPKRHDRLGKVAPGLELAVDYGVLWFIAKPLFMVLRFIHDLTGNWGWAIILLTVLLKLIFFPLSAAGYRSMANMRKVQPRMLALRDRYADDRAQLNQAMMQLYKDEKINPLGGCLPILVQIPVFIALYWVLLESVEMRQAPFILWLNDLSTRDPYFVLPLLMGISMWGQQKLNPAPLDPTQAKVMQILPFVFTVFFAFFPSGLVLYWLVNNILSIAQQWQITRAIENAEG